MVLCCSFPQHPPNHNHRHPQDDMQRTTLLFVVLLAPTCRVFSVSSSAVPSNKSPSFHRPLSRAWTSSAIERRAQISRSMKSKEELKGEKEDQGEFCWKVEMPRRRRFALLLTGYWARNFYFIQQKRKCRWYRRGMHMSEWILTVENNFIIWWGFSNRRRALQWKNSFSQFTGFLSFSFGVYLPQMVSWPRFTCEHPCVREFHSYSFEDLSLVV